MHEDDMEKRTEQLSLRVSDRVLNTLMRIAAHEDRTVSDVTYRLIEAALFGMAERVNRRASDRNANDAGH